MTGSSTVSSAGHMLAGSVASPATGYTNRNTAKVGRFSTVLPTSSSTISSAGHLLVGSTANPATVL